MNLMKSLCTATTCEAKSSTPEATMQTALLSENIVSRCRWRKVSGSPRRQASSRRPTHTAAATIKPMRRSPSSVVFVIRWKAIERQPKYNAASKMKPRSAAIQARIAARPTRLLPATSWADPGMTRVIPSKVSARRNRMRAESSSASRLAD
jgi:hypothetical protein